MNVPIIRRKSVENLLTKLVRINSVNKNVVGGNGEGNISEFLADYFQGLGLEVHTQKVGDDRFNVIGFLRGLGKGKTLLLNGHTDTVSSLGMTIDPFDPFIEDDKLHGRGACDMKGGLTGMILAVEELINSKVSLKGDILITAVVDEEHQSLGTKRLIQEYHADAVIVGEPTNLQIGIAHKGCLWLSIKTKGKSAHGSVPEKGIDAIKQMAKIISSLPILNKSLIKESNELLGFPSVHSSMIHGGSAWNIIPDFCQLDLERRTIPGETTEDVIDELSKIFKRLSHEDSCFIASVEKVFARPPMEISPNEDIVSCLSDAVQEICKEPSSIIGVPYWSDASLFVNNASTPACLFGPGMIEQAHSADEFVKIHDVVQSAKIYVQVAKNFCGKVI